MKIVDKEVDRVLTLLRNKIREKGFTQLEVQEALGWGRSYISQLLTKQKSLRVEQVLLILSVIGIEPAAFFAELYYAPQAMGAVGGGPPWSPPAPPLRRVGEEEPGSFKEMQALVRGLVWILVEKDLIDMDELTATVKTQRDGGDAGPDHGPAN